MQGEKVTKDKKNHEENRKYVLTKVKKANNIEEMEVRKMLIRFNVKNFLSFAVDKKGGSQEFSMIAGKVRGKKERIFDDDKLKLLKFSAIFGANASGKSNLVKALDFMKKSVIDELPNGHTDRYCKTSPENKNKTSYFEIEIYINKKYYSYGFEILLSKSEYIAEWLVELLPDNKEKKIFTRDIRKNKYEFGSHFKNKDNGLIRKLDLYAYDIANDGSLLLLSDLNKNKKKLYEEHEEAEVFQSVYKWIENSLDINYPDQPISDYSYMVNNSNNIKEVYKIISSFGTGITGFEIVEVSGEKFFKNVPKEVAEKIMAVLEKKVNEEKLLEKEVGEPKIVMAMRSPRDFFLVEISAKEDVRFKTIQFAHGKNKVRFDLDEESDGTRRILDLIEVLICNKENKVYVIDELDRCLHPSLTYRFVELFLQIAKSRNIQLIATTHESRILDFDLLRRDEVWMIEKSLEGESNLYSLEEYDIRFDKKVDKAYLEGRYGGIPIFNTLFPISKEECL